MKDTKLVRFICGALFLPACLLALYLFVELTRFLARFIGEQAPSITFIVFLLCLFFGYIAASDDGYDV